MLQIASQMVSNAREFMSDRLVRPVLRRANSVKSMRDRAAGRIDGAIDAADRYVERILPNAAAAGDCVDGNARNNDNHNDDDDAAAHTSAVAAAATDGEAVHRTLHKGHRLSRKLKRRLTQRTVSEARALQLGAGRAVHVVWYAAELAVRDPRLACRRAAELWGHLSGPEPENQARPRTLEQLLVLVVRESARTAVHAANWVTALVVPRNLVHYWVARVHVQVSSRNRVPKHINLWAKRNA